MISVALVVGAFVPPTVEASLSPTEIGVHAVTPTPSDLFAERARALRSGGGFTVACHPQQYPENGAQNILSAADDLHAVEIFNGLRESIGCDKAANVPLWDELLTVGKRCGPAPMTTFTSL